MEMPKKSRVKSVSRDLEKCVSDGVEISEKELLEADLHDMKQKPRLFLTMTGFLCMFLIAITVLMVREEQGRFLGASENSAAVGLLHAVGSGSDSDVVKNMAVSGSNERPTGGAGAASVQEKLFQESVITKLINGLKGKKKVQSNDINFFNVDEIADNDELSKYVEQRITEVQQQHSKGSVSAHANSQVSMNEDSLVDPKKDLQEILSVHAIVILSDEDGTSANSKQFKFENILMNLNIVPEPKVVNLAKHPHFSDIISYLKMYSSHESQTKSEPTSVGTKKDIDLTNRVINENNEDIPRLFVGGHPLANYDDVFEKYETKELASFLREHGKGILTID